MSQLKPFDASGVEEKLTWEKPERRDQAGSIIIFGGASLKLKAVDQIYSCAKEKGAGQILAAVPESLARGFRKKDLPMVEVNFDRYFGLTDQGQKTLLDEFGLADAVIIADIGSSAATWQKTAVLVSASLKPAILTPKAFGLSLSYQDEILQNPNIYQILTISNLQKLQKASASKSQPILSTQNLKQKLQVLADLQKNFKSGLILIDDGRILVIQNDQYFFSQKNKFSAEEVAASIAVWSVWSPKSTLLEKLVMA